MQANQRYTLLFVHLGPCCVTYLTSFVSQQDMVVLFAVERDAPVGGVTTTFTLISSRTEDTGPGNNQATITLTVDRRADLQISLYVGSLPLCIPI